MRELVFLFLTSTIPLLGGCSTEPTVCAQGLGVLTASVANQSGQPLAGLSVTDTIRRTGVVLHVLAGSAGTLEADSVRVVPIFPDSVHGALAPFGDDVIVVVTADERSASTVYRLAFNGCSVERLAGPDTLIVR